jgi:hypothetical protein
MDLLYSLFKVQGAQKDWIFSRLLMWNGGILLLKLGGQSWNEILKRILAVLLPDNCTFDRTNCNVRRAIFRLTSNPSNFDCTNCNVSRAIFHLTSAPSNFDCTNFNVRRAIFRFNSAPSTFLPPSNYFHAAWNFFYVQYVCQSTTHHVLLWSGNSEICSGNSCFVFPVHKLFVQNFTCSWAG